MGVFFYYTIILMLKTVLGLSRFKTLSFPYWKILLFSLMVSSSRKIIQIMGIDVKLILFATHFVSHIHLFKALLKSYKIKVIWIK